MLLFEVNGQSLKRTDHFNPATDSVGYLKAKFTFNDSAWSGKTKTALFRMGTDVYKSVLGTDGTCKVPAEVLVGGDSRVAMIHGEIIHVSLIGEYSTVRITTNEVAVKLNRSGYADAETPADPTESEYQQMTAVAADAVAEAENARSECENARADLVGVKNLFANAIKGNLSGAVVFADDVSLVEHNPIVKVRGANLIPFPYYDTGGEISGITYTVNDDGSVTAKGTATANAAFYLIREMSGIKGTVFMSGCPDGGSISASSGGGYSLRMNKLTGGAWATGTTDSGSGGKITLDGETISIYIVVLSGKTVDCTFYPMLNYGESANAYTKSDLTTVTVRRCGKNIFSVAAKSQTQNGVTFTVNDDGSVTANGTATKATFIGLGSLVLKPDEKYRLSGSPTGSGFETYLLYIHNNTTGADTYDLGEGKVFTGKDGDLGVTIAVYAGNTVNNLRFRPMVVYGEESGDFEPYNGAVYTPTADGTVSGLTSLSPNMTILTDTEGAIVECEYIRDTNKVIEKLTKAITALGGTV